MRYESRLLHNGISSIAKNGPFHKSTNGIYFCEKDVLVYGSCDLVHTLKQQNLIDEYRLVIYPVVVGSGKRLFRQGREQLALKLVEARPFSSGTVLLRYQKE